MSTGDFGNTVSGDDIVAPFSVNTVVAPSLVPTNDLEIQILFTVVKMSPPFSLLCYKK